VSAKLESVKEDLLTLGGLLGRRRGFVPIGIQIISNHHLFTEALWSSRVARAAAAAASGGAGGEGAGGLAAIADGDAALEAALDARRLDPDGAFARDIGELLIDASSREGPAVYLAARAVARSRLSTAAYDFPDGGDAEADLSPEARPAEVARFFELQAHAFARAGTAVRRHVRLFRAALARAGASEGGRLVLRRVALERLVADGVAGLAAREARLAAWTPPPPPASAPIDWRYPLGLAALLGAVAGGVAWWRRRP
jgi:hypothetical protein